MQQEIIINDIYLPLLDNHTRVQILFGGSSSGKSKFRAQHTVIDILQGKRNYLICRAVAKTIKRSVFAEIKKVITECGLLDKFKINETDLTITCKNGYQILFAGLDDTEKLKSITPAKGVITDIWLEEATEANREDVKQLLKRQRGGDEQTAKRLFMTFNPIIRQHWIFKEYFAPIGWADEQTEYSGDGLYILKTIYKDNRFLTNADISDLENEKDPYFYNVYTLGNWGVLGNVIFTNWKIQDLSGMRDQFTNRRNGLDFGFSTDPAALSRSHYDKTRKTIYIFEELYETDLTNDILAERIKDMLGVYKEVERVDNSGKVIKELVFDGTERLICDSAEPKSVAELRRYKVDAYGARKGKDSVVHGIQWLQQQTIIIDTKCINMQNEIQTYKWKEDAGGAVVKSGGLPVPVDKNNHLIDATRYAYEDDSNDIGVMESIESPFFN